MITIFDYQKLEARVDQAYIDHHGFLLIYSSALFACLTESASNMDPTAQRLLSNCLKAGRFIFVAATPTFASFSSKLLTKVHNYIDIAMLLLKKSCDPKGIVAHIFSLGTKLSTTAASPGCTTCERHMLLVSAAEHMLAIDQPVLESVDCMSDDILHKHVADIVRLD